MTTSVVELPGRLLLLVTSVDLRLGGDWEDFAAATAVDSAGEGRHGGLEFGGGVHGGRVVLVHLELLRVDRRL